MAHDQTSLATSVAASNAAESAPRRPLPPVGEPAEVADPGLIRLGAAVGKPQTRR